MTRRDLLAGALAGLIPGGPRKTVFIEMAGGPSHADTFDLHVGPWTPDWMEPVRHGRILFPAGLMPNLAAMLDRITLLRGLRARSLDHHSIALPGAGPLLRASRASFGDVCKESAAWLDRGERFVHIRLAGWDHHGNLYEQLRPLAASFDAGVAWVRSIRTAAAIMTRFTPRW